MGELKMKINELINWIDNEIDTTKKQIATKIKQAETINQTKVTKDQISYICDTLFYLNGYLRALTNVQEEIYKILKRDETMNKKNINISKKALEKIDEIMEQYEYPYYTAGPDGKPKEIRKKRRSVNCR